ncbi:MAG: FAD-binding oxidoreductase [Sedimenticola sp.]|nr:FAD-binding oxidoreductase [Sedimenticola sp.]
MALLTLFACFFCTTPLLADELKPFTSDGCSAFPNGTLQQQSLWANCCISHDLAYWQGGTYEQRVQADQALQACVAGAGEEQIADLMLAGVRVGGSPYWPTPFRWGYGWSYGRGYQPVTDAEHQLIKVRLKQLQVILDSLSQTLNSELTQ